MRGHVYHVAGTRRKPLITLLSSIGGGLDMASQMMRRFSQSLAPQRQF